MATNPDSPQADKIASNYQGETKEHIAAFQLYLSMGEKRSIAAVANHLGKSKATVQNWSLRYEWHARVLAIQEE